MRPERAAIGPRVHEGRYHPLAAGAHESGIRTAAATWPDGSGNRDYGHTKVHKKFKSPPQKF